MLFILGVITIIRTLNLNRQTTGILENAYNIGYEKEVNAIWQASFSLPLNDPKVSKVELLKYVEITDDDEYIGLFRVIPKLTRKNSQANYVTYQCEHVLATLMDSSLFKYHQLTNYTTDQVIEYLLNQQKHKHWKKGKVDFTRYFHYAWENENLISSIFSVPKPFDEPYIWEHDTQSYPWTLELNVPETEPICRIKEGYNLVGLEIEENPMGVYNRIYPLGAGEGVNQLGIESVNNGVPYIEDWAPGEEIREYIWVDRRFEDVESLFASAKALLKKWKEPVVTWNISAADVSKITGLSIDKFKVGKVVRLQLDDFPTVDLRIMKESKPDIKGDPGNIQLHIGNVVEDLSTTNADLERRQQINELYSQGATNTDSYTFNENADPDFPAIIEFPFPEDMINVNEAILRIKTSPYRVPMRGMKAGGHYQKESVVQSSSTSDGGAHIESSVVKASSTKGGGQFVKPGEVKTTESDNITSVGATAGPLYVDGVLPDYANHVHQINPAWFKHTHLFTIPGFTIQAHTHDFEVEWPGFNLQPHKHNFSITIPAITVPDHVHEQIYGIHEVESDVSNLSVKIDGVEVSFSGTEGEIDITDYLKKDSNGKVTRDYHKIEVTPNDFARIDLILRTRFFIQSRIGGNF